VTSVFHILLFLSYFLREFPTPFGSSWFSKFGRRFDGLIVVFFLLIRTIISGGSLPERAVSLSPSVGIEVPSISLWARSKDSYLPVLSLASLSDLPIHSLSYLGITPAQVSRSCDE